MPNTQAPFGFQQWSGNGATPTYEQTTRLIASNNATAIFNGDPVVSLSTGYITRATAGTTQIAGIFVGCKFLSTSQKRTIWLPYWPGSDAASDIEAYVIADPNAKFKVQAGGSSTPITLAAVNNNINFGLGTGNTSTGNSGAFADQTTINTTTTLPFRITQLLTDPPGWNGSDATTGYNYVIVAFNWMDAKSTTGI